MGNGNRAPPRLTDPTLVDSTALKAALHDQAENLPEARCELLDQEPVLSSFPHGETLKLLGKLAVSGVHPGVLCPVGHAQ